MPDTTPREAARRTYVIDDFALWDKALHDAAREFHTTFRAYPTHVLAHPTTFARFLVRADPDNIRDEDGEDLAGDVDVEDGAIEVFVTDDYEMRFVEDPSLWPITVALALTPPGAAPPHEDTPPRPMLVGTGTDLDRPSASRPLHTVMLFKAHQCCSCRFLVGLGTCAAFPDGIPLALQQSRADHRAPFDGDGGVRFEPTIDPGAPWDGPFFPHPTDAPFRYRRVDSPTHVKDPAPGAGWVGDRTLAPEAPSRDEARARLRPLIRETLAELGGPEAIEASDLGDLLRVRYPTTIAVLDHRTRGGYEAWRRFVASSLAGLRTAARRRANDLRPKR